jgi:hypothetical protein
VAGPVGDPDPVTEIADREHDRDEPGVEPRRSPGQLALAVDTAFLVTVDERRGEPTSLTVGPFPEDDARALAALLLNRAEPPHGAGPWRCAIAGGSRLVTLTQAS